MTITYKILSRVSGYDDNTECEWDKESIDANRLTYLEIRLDDPAPSEEDIQEWKAEMYEYYRHGCSCIYDCCGHWFGGVGYIVQKYRDDRAHYIVQIRSARNY